MIYLTQLLCPQRHCIAVERFGVRMLIIHERHTREVAERLIKEVNCYPQGGGES